MARYLFWKDSIILIFNKMKKSILKIEGVNELSKEHLKNIKGGAACGPGYVVLVCGQGPTWVPNVCKSPEAHCA